MNRLDAVLAAWLPVFPLLHRRGVPAALEWIGGDLAVAVVPEEDRRHYVWLGSGDTEDCDGPWLSLRREWVGGYRYIDYTDDDGSHVFLRSEGEMVRVEDPGSDESVAEAMATCWRTLRGRPCVETV